MTIWLENKNKKTAHPGLRTYRCSPVCIYRVQGGCGNTVHSHILHLVIPDSSANSKMQPSHTTASSSIAKINVYFQVTGTWVGSDRPAELPEFCLFSAYLLVLFGMSQAVQLHILLPSFKLLLFIAQIPLVSSWASFLKMSPQ